VLLARGLPWQAASRSPQLEPAGWRRRACCGALAALLICIANVAPAQVISPSVQPGRERERFTEPQAPRAQPRGAPIALPSTTAPPEAKTVTLVIRRVRVVGSTVFRDEDFAPLYQDLIGRRVTLQAVYDLAQAITAKYGAAGYVLTRAIVPEQELSPGGATVRIEVVEGYIDRVVWPAKLSRYRDFFSDYTARITAERPINIRTLERYLLLASDLPGLKFTTTLKASPTAKGAATLVVEVVEKPVDWLARIDNRGTRARGPLQFLISPTINNLMGQHESISLSYASVSPIKELQYVAAVWRQVLNSEGLTGFVNGSFSWSYPGTADLEALDFKTRSTYAEAGAFFPVIRSRERNLVVTGLVFMGENYSFWNVTPDDPQAVDRLRGVRLRVEGDLADKLGGINQFSATVSQGIAGAGSTDNDNILASRRGGRVDFTKFEALVSRMQPLVDRFSALVAVYGQYAWTPLLVPEQCGYGGRVFGRAFDPSELLADHCWMASLELRYDIPPGAVGSPLKGSLTPLPALQFYGFTDMGKLYRIAVGSVGTGAVTFTGASAGGGVRLWWQNYFNVDLSAAKAIEGPRDGWRFFFIATVRH
jgi:hemolysin activation/secretion protein